ncbi:AsmA family protein [Flavobacterium pectinovorum]|uniref:AsmA family protein n=1 Tax=Flavobacterium pectinovorum TaxID=29533 RepID=UPI001FAD2045|nr:AsmA family protein [Flavobacterium pectinovorum]MCI9845217.1 AsmA family protein [Flavobacterium pectinovorum]
MQKTLYSVKTFLQSVRFKKFVKRLGFFILGCITLIVIASGALSFYFNRNKTEIIAKINTKINENVNGKFHIGDFQYKFLTGFPNFTLALKDVELKDNQWNLHKHTLLKATEIVVRLNVLSLLQKEINIHKILINDAQIYVYKAENGYSNANIFKPKKKKTPESKSDTETTIDQINLNNVHFVLDNRIGHKLFDFDVANLKSKVKYDDENWQTDVFLKTNIKSLAFNTVHGSFAKQKLLQGTFAVSYVAEKDKIDVKTENLKIGKDAFDIVAFFNLAKGNALFGINISTTILWKDASNLLSANISSKLNRFNLKKEIDVNCDIKGDFNAKGDPKIVVQAEVKNNELSIPDGSITDCGFKGIFTNNFRPTAGFNDANSAVILTRLSGKYKNIPLTIPQLSINNLDKPLATGIVKSDFDIENLNEENTERWINFTEGHATANLKFQFDIVDLYITKPRFIGNVNIQNASFHFIPKNVHAEKINVQLEFTQEALLIKKIAYKNKNNTIYIEGRIDNFLNLYYDAPEKMVVNWNIYCPSIDIRQFLGVLASSQKKKITAKKPSMSNQLRTAIEKCIVDISIKADKITYNKLTATNTKARIQMIDSRLVIKNGSLQTCGGSINFSTTVSPKGKNYNFASNAQVNQVDITSFLKSFNNFGITSFSPNNIRGKLTSSTNVTGLINSNGELIPNSAHGNLTFNVSQGALRNFEPIMKIGKFAFPFRDVENITFSDLSGNFKLRGEQVDVNKLTISSSILNMDATGVYSFGRGTNLALTVPLRNSKDDAKLATKAERDAVRQRGIVLHLLAVDDNGKMKIKWGKKDK